jgi:hypothetical protein
MNGDDFDARLRRLFAGTDTAPGFEARVFALVAALPAVPVAELRLQYERRRQEARERMRRDAWLNAATAVGAGVAAIALIWREGPAVARWVENALAASLDGGALAGLACLTLGLGVWVTFGRLGGRL